MAYRRASKVRYFSSNNDSKYSKKKGCKKKKVIRKKVIRKRAV